DQLFEEVLDVLQQRVLPLVDEHRRGGVQRLQMHDAVPDAALANDFVDAVRDVDQLRTVAGDPVHDAVEDPETGLPRRTVFGCDDLRLNRLSAHRTHTDSFPSTATARLPRLYQRGTAFAT